MYETLPFENYTPAELSVWLGLIVGVLFGALALVSGFCLRRAIAGDRGERASAGAAWALALAVAVIGTQYVVSLGVLDLGGHRFMTGDLPIVAIVGGGLLFGIGMVLARGCAARLTVLAASGNLRAATVVLVFAVVAHATLKGLLSSWRVAAGSVTVPYGGTLPLPGWVWGIAFAALAIALIVKSRASWTTLVPAALLGLLVPAAWAGTGYVLNDPFDPITIESLAFTSTWTESLFYVIASTAVAPTFGTALIAGTLVGSLVISLLTGRFQWQSFESAGQTGRYLVGAALMGFGGVLAGGCTIGAGLAGVPLLSVAAVLALVSMIAGARITAVLLERRTSVSPALVPAE